MSGWRRTGGAGGRGAVVRGLRRGAIVCAAAAAVASPGAVASPEVKTPATHAATASRGGGPAGRRVALAAPGARQRPEVTRGPRSEVAALAAALRERLQIDALEAHTRAIVAYERPSGSTGENAAIDQIVAVLRDDGVPVQVHEFEAYVSDPVRAAVALAGRERTFAAITAAFSGSVQGLEAPLVDLGGVADLPPPDVASGERLVVTEGPDLQGKVALVRGLPMPEAAYVLERLGAAAAIFVNPEERLNELITTTVWGTPSWRNAHRVPRLPVTQVRRSDGEALARAARRGDKVRLDVQVDTGWRKLRLAVARIEPAADAPYVLLGGHIDAWYYGGTDEGAANAAMLELARAAWATRDRLRRGLVVAWWPGHSNGRYAGSTWFADAFYGELARRAIAYLNVDGIGQRGAARFGASATASLRALAGRVLAGAGDVRIGVPGRNSDESFNGVGMPLLQFYHAPLPEQGGTWWWHTPEDTIDKVDFEVLLTDAGLYAAALAELLAGAAPIDATAEIDDLRGRIEALRPGLAGAVDVDGVLAGLASLRRRWTSVGAAGGRGGPVSERALLAARMLRPLYRVLFTLAGPFHPDPAVEMGLLPGLALARDAGWRDGPRAGFARTELVREGNRLQAAIDEALRWLETAGGR